MNFAPYQDVDPERERALSPPPQDGRRSKSPQIRTPPTRSNASPPNLPHPNAFGNDYVSAGNNDGLGDRGVHFDAFQTSLPLRLDYEAMLAYILLPPAGPVLLLLMEHKSDYVRYEVTLAAGSGVPVMLIWSADFMPGSRACSSHAYLYAQSLYLEIVVSADSSKVVHLVFSWSSVISWMLFVIDLALIGFLALHAYRDGMCRLQKKVRRYSDLGHSRNTRSL